MRGQQLNAIEASLSVEFVQMSHNALGWTFVGGWQQQPQ